MREAVGGTWLFQIVIVFILLFAGFMCLNINHSKAFNVKDRIIQTIQSNNGLDLTSQCNNLNDDTTICEIARYLINNAYRNTGSCSGLNNGTVTYTGFTREGKIASSGNASFCVAKVNSGGSQNSEFQGELPSVSYYRVAVFYQLDLPIFNNLFNFHLTGDTKTIYVK